MTPTPSCTTCTFGAPAVGDDETPFLNCRRYPPQVGAVDGEPAIVWPQVTEGDWCGEWTDGLVAIVARTGRVVLPSPSEFPEP